MAYNQILAVKGYYGKASRNPLVHIIVVYDDGVKDINTSTRFSQQCAQFFASKFQVLYCTHKKDFQCGNFHTHIIVNSVSYINGQKNWFYFDNKADY